MSSFSTFGVRLRQAFSGASNAEIARQLGKSEPAIKNYLDGRIPSAEILVEISGLTNCSVDWLLTGKGDKSLTPRVIERVVESELEKYLRRIVREEMAKAGRREEQNFEFETPEDEARIRAGGRNLADILAEREQEAA